MSYRKRKANFLDIIKSEKRNEVIKNTLNLNLSHDEKECKKHFLLHDNEKKNENFFARVEAR